MSDKLQKSNQKLSEAQKYYIDLFTKWKMWQEICPEKLPESHQDNNKNRAIGIKKFDFEKMIFSVLKRNNRFMNEYFALANHDEEVRSILIEPINPYKDVFIIDTVHLSLFNNKVFKPVEIKHERVYDIFRNVRKIYFGFESCCGDLKITNSTDLEIEIDFVSINKFKYIELNNIDLVYSPKSSKQNLLEYFKNNKLELINCNFPELDNLKLQNELAVYKQNNQLSTNRIKVFHFNQKLLGDYKASFAEYFMGLKDFILYAQGKNIGVDIHLNGSLELKVYSDNEQDLDAIRLSINDYVSNLLNPNDEPKIHSGLNAVDPQKALILMKSKLNSLETSLQLKDSQLITNENLIKYLKEVALDFQSKNEVLSEQNKQLASQLDETISIISTLKFQLTQIKVNDLYANDKIDTIINLLGTLTLVISQKESTKLTKEIINQMSDFEKVNREFFEKIKLPEIGFKIGEVDLKANMSTISISDLLQQIINQLYRNF